jgi:type II secretion system protein J
MTNRFRAHARVAARPGGRRPAAHVKGPARSTAIHKKVAHSAWNGGRQGSRHYARSAGFQPAFRRLAAQNPAAEGATFQRIAVLSERRSAARVEGAPRRNLGKGGFTLIEVLLAIILSAVMAAAVFGTLAAGRDAARRGEILGELDQVARQATELIAADIRLAVKPSETYDTGFVGTLSGDDSEARDTLDFITSNSLPDPERMGPVDAEDGERPRRIDLARVLWSIDDDPTTPERGLVRAEQTLLTTASVQQNEDLDKVEVAPEATALRFRYLLGSSWSTTWDSRQSNTLPQAVEITLTVRIERYGTTHARTVKTVVRCLFSPPTTQMSTQ